MGTWASEMKSSGHVASQSGASTAGDATFSDPVPFRYRHEKTTVVRRDADGVYYDSRDLLITHDAVGQGDAVWLEGADKGAIGEAKLVASVDVSSDLDGEDTLYEVLL